MRWRSNSALAMAGLSLLLLFGWWLLPVALRSNSKNVLRRLAAPIHYGGDCIGCAVGHWSLRAQSKEWLERKIVELSRDLANEKLLNRIDECRRALESIDMARSGRQLPGFMSVYGRVLRRDETAWWKELLLSAGSSDGVANGAAAVCGEHLVGKILTLSSGSSVAIMVTDPRFHAIVHCFGDGRPIVYEGVAQSGFGHPIGRVSCVPSDAVASESNPLRIVTSSLSGTYPDGIAIGTVSKLEPSGDGIFQEGEVKLSQVLSSLRELAILVPIDRKL